MSNFVVKDSGKRIDYATGARRDTDEGKPRYDLISHHMLTRLAHHLRKGAEKYGDRNWEKGIPTWRLVASGLRHVYAYIAGDRTEDHLSAIIFNFGAIVHFEESGGNPADKPPVPAYPWPLPAGARVFRHVPPADAWPEDFVWDPGINKGFWITRTSGRHFESNFSLESFTDDDKWVEVQT